MKKLLTITIASLLPLLCYSGALDGVRLVASEVTICKGTTIDLSKYVESTPPGTTTSWSAGGSTVDEEQLPDATTSYTAIFTNGDETTQRSIRVNVILPPTISAVNPTGAAANICRGGTVTLNATANSYSEVKWYLKGSVTPIANGTTLPPFTSTGTFTYEVNALPINEVCRIATGSATITVVNPTLAINVTGNQTKNLCRGDMLALDNSIRVSTNPNNANVTLNVTKQEWKDESGNTINAANAISFSTAGTYKFTVDIEASARYVSGGSCGTIEAKLNNGNTLRRTITVVVDSCQPTLQGSADSVCEGSKVNLQINKNRLKFTWSNVSFFPTINASDVQEDNDKITFSVQALSNSTIVRVNSISASYAESGNAAAVAAIAPVSITAKTCLPRVSCNTKACPGKNFSINVDGNTNVIDSIRVTDATDIRGLDKGELTPALKITKVPNATSYNLTVNPGDTTIYSMMVYYKVGTDSRSTLLSIQVNPYSPQQTSCRPQFRYASADSVCLGFEQAVSIDNKGYTIDKVVWTQTCGSGDPTATATNNLQWRFTPATSCTYKGVIQYIAGAQMLSAADSFVVKVRSCPPLLQVDTCPGSDPDCNFSLGTGNGGKNGVIEQTLCSGQKTKFYLHHYMGVNRVASASHVRWTPSVQLDTLIKDAKGNDSISVFWAQPTISTTYTAAIGYQNTVTLATDTTYQGYKINSIACTPPVYAPSSLCRGNELQFFIPKKYKDNTVISVTPPAGVRQTNSHAADPDTLFFSMLPKVYGSLNFPFSITYNTSAEILTRTQSLNTQVDTCVPEITISPTEAQCEGTNVNFTLRKNKLVFSKDSVTFSGSENTFRPKYDGSDNASQIAYRIMAHSYPNDLSASIRLQNGEQQQVQLGIDGKLCEPHFTAPGNEVCPKTDFTIGVVKNGSYRLDSVQWHDKSLVKNAVDRYTGNLAYSNTFQGDIFYSYGDETDTVRTWTNKEAPVKVFRQVFVCDDTTICRGSVVNLNSIIKANVSIPAYIDTVKSPYFTDTFFIPARVADCTNPSQAKTVEESIVIVVDSAIWVASMKDTVMCLGDSITLNATGLGRFSWFSADSSEIYGSPLPRVSPQTTTSYVATVKNACGPKFDTALVVVKTLPEKPTPIYGVHAPLAHNYYTYFIEADPSVDRYEWEYPPDWEVNGVGSDSIQFRFSETAGELAVTAHNVCGLATYSEKIDVRNGYDIVVYPNPVSSLLYLKARSCRMERIAVYNTGMVAMLPVVVFNNPQNEFTINVDALVPNHYFLMVWVDQQKKPLVYKFAKYDERR